MELEDNPHFQEFSETVDEKIRELVSLVLSGEKTKEEAARMLADWTLSYFDKVGRKRPLDYDEFLKSRRITIDRRLPDWQELRRGLHY